MQKEDHRNRFLLGSLLCTAALIIGGIIVNKKQTCEEPECFLINTLKGYNNIEVYQNTDRVFSALLKKEEIKLRVEAWLNIEQHETETIIKNHTIQMYTLYEKAVSPYPGEISNAISCTQEYRPTYFTEQKGGRETHVFTGYASSRLTFGVCTDDIVANRALVAMFYCEEQKRLYKLELFTPIGVPIEKFNEEAGLIRAMPCEQASPKYW